MANDTLNLSNRNWLPRLLATAGIVALLAGEPLSAQVNVLTANYGNERTNANLAETTLTRSNVAVGTFGKLGILPVDGQVYAQPLYASGVSIPGQGTHNVLFVGTQHNSVFAYDADSLVAPLVLWQTNLGPSYPSSLIPGYKDIQPEIGILGTPVIDLQRNALYVVSMNLTNGAPI